MYMYVHMSEFVCVGCTKACRGYVRLCTCIIDSTVRVEWRENVPILTASKNR